MKRNVSVLLGLVVAVMAWRAMLAKPLPSAPIPTSSSGSATEPVAPIVEQPADKRAPDKDAAPAALLRVIISPEARVQAAAVAGGRELRAGDWTTFRVVIENAAGITAPLVIESDQLMQSDHDTHRDRWLQLQLEPSGPLTGQRQETRTLRLRSRDIGVRAALLNVNAGQGTQDLGFRNDVLLSFRVLARAK